MILIAFVLSSCAYKIEPDFSELSSELSASSGRELVRTDAGDGCGYMFGLSDEDFDRYVMSAEIYREAIGSSGYELALVTVNDGESAEELRRIMTYSYEWAPCDPSETAIFADYPGLVMRVKGSESDVRRAYEIFCAACGKNSCGKSELAGEGAG